MADIEEDDGGGIPEWVVTFGDMMSLLLTFFIMLVSLSEMKQEEKYQAMVEAMKKRFGYDATSVSAVPGDAKPRNSIIAQLATMGRAKKFDTMQGGDRVAAPIGDQPRVRVIRPGSHTAVGTVIVFPEGQATLSDQQRRDLDRQAAEIIGKPQKIEIRGHSSRRALRDGGHTDTWDLAYRRCRATMQYLIEVGVNPKRIRMAVAGANEPQHIGADPDKLRRNSRVEVFMLDEVVDDLEGTPGEQDQRYLRPKQSAP